MGGVDDLDAVAGAVHLGLHAEAGVVDRLDQIADRVTICELTVTLAERPVVSVIVNEPAATPAPPLSDASLVFSLTVLRPRSPLFCAVRGRIDRQTEFLGRLLGIAVGHDEIVGGRAGGIGQLNAVAGGVDRWPECRSPAELIAASTSSIVRACDRSTLAELPMTIGELERAEAGNAGAPFEIFKQRGGQPAEQAGCRYDATRSRGSRARGPRRPGSCSDR